MDGKQDWLDAWNPTKNPPRWYHCKACNGQGCHPYGEPCDCHYGYKYAFISEINSFITKQDMNFQEFKCWLRAFPLHRCHECGKWYWSDVELCPNINCGGSLPF